MSYVQNISYKVSQSIRVRKISFWAIFQAYRTMTLDKELHYICVKFGLDFSKTNIEFLSININIYILKV